MTLTPAQARVRLNAVEQHLKMAKLVAPNNIGVDSCAKAIQELTDFLRAALT